MSESVALFAQIGQAPNTVKCHMSESVELCTQINKAPNTGNCHMSESVEHLAQIDRAETQVTTACRRADPWNSKVYETDIQSSSFMKMRHDAMDDDEKDTSDDGNSNRKENHEFDGAVCENVIQILDMTIQKPGFRNSADQFGLVGTMGSVPPEGSKKAS